VKTYCLIIFLIFPSPGKNLLTNDLHYKQSVSIEDRLSDKLFKIAEFKHLTRQLSKKNEKAGIHATIIVPDKPTIEDPYYVIWLGYDHPERFENVYTLRIRSNYINNINLLPYLEIYDDDKFVPLLKWRNKNKLNK